MAEPGQSLSSAAAASKTRQPTNSAITPDLAYEKSWKHVGYRGFSRVLASHEHFLHVRLFRTLNARVILAMQDHISVLE